MKRVYVKPFAEKVKFNYQDQIVASNGASHECAGIRKDSYSMCRDVTIWTD